MKKVPVRYPPLNATSPQKMGNEAFSIGYEPSHVA